jgi:hypothetical protein
LMISFSWVSWIWLNCCHSSTNCRRATSVSIRWRPHIHFLPSRATTTVWFFLQANLKHSGVMSIGACPLSHLSLRRWFVSHFQLWC